MKTLNNRTADYDVLDIFLNRYSPRAMSGEAISKEELFTLFEAARWAQSASNGQPWRFLYAMKDTPDFELFFSFLKEGNKIWCNKAGVLIVVLSKNNSADGKPQSTHSFDAGAACQNLALQGSGMGLVVHFMAGFDTEMVRTTLGIPADCTVEAMAVVGKKGNVEDLPEFLQAREKPSTRNAIDTFAVEGKEGVNHL